MWNGYFFVFQINTQQGLCNLLSLYLPSLAGYKVFYGLDLHGIPIEKVG